jgi:membrane protease subunit HflK
VENTFRDISEATMREIVGNRSVDEVITWGKEEINLEAETKLQELCDQYETGITVKVVLLQDVNAPPPVQPSWNEVNEAEQEKDKLINQAKSQYNTEVPRASGQAERVIKEAEGYAIERVNQALGEAHKFLAVYEEYKKAPEVTRRRFYLETMAHIIPRAGRKVIVDQDETGILRMLDLGAKGGGK